MNRPPLFRALPLSSEMQDEIAGANTGVALLYPRGPWFFLGRSLVSRLGRPALTIVPCQRSAFWTRPSEPGAFGVPSRRVLASLTRRCVSSQHQVVVSSRRAPILGGQYGDAWPSGIERRARCRVARLRAASERSSRAARWRGCSACDEQPNEPCCTSQSDASIGSVQLAYLTRPLPDPCRMHNRHCESRAPIIPAEKYIEKKSVC